MIDINIIFHWFLFCTIWTFGSKVTANLVKSIWISLVWLWRNLSELFIKNWSNFTPLFLAKHLLLHDVRVDYKTQHCDLIEWLILCMLLHLAIIIVSACRVWCLKSIFTCVQALLGLPQCLRLLLKLAPHVKYHVPR